MSERDAAEEAHGALEDIPNECRVCRIFQCCRAALGTDEFADHTNQEFKTIYNGFRPSKL